MTPKALEMFNAALALDAGDAKARYFVALAMDQAGKKKEALDAWLVLQRRPLGDEPWVAELRERTQALARELKVDVSGRDPLRQHRGRAEIDGSRNRPPRKSERSSAACRSATSVIREMVKDWRTGCRKASRRRGLVAAHTLAVVLGEEQAARDALAKPCGLLRRCVGRARIAAAARELGVTKTSPELGTPCR